MKVSECAEARGVKSGVVGIVLVRLRSSLMDHFEQKRDYSQPSYRQASPA